MKYKYKLTNEDRIERFKDTREHTMYNDLLQTKIYTEDDLSKIDIKKTDNWSKYDIDKETWMITDTNLSINSYISTLEGLLDNNIRDMYVAVLNFADGFTPGGNVLTGGISQEAMLCRSSNLYESLSLPICRKEYYDYNSKFGDKASDRIIYTRNVTVFKYEESWLIDPIWVRRCDVITCTAPVKGTATDDEIEHRMKNIIKVADDNRVNVLILGCWGCGKSGNDWDHMSKIWLDLIREMEPNCRILFATYGHGTRLDYVFGKSFSLEGSNEKEDVRTEYEMGDWLYGSRSNI